MSQSEDVGLRDQEEQLGGIFAGAARVARRLSSGLSFGLSRNLTGGWGLGVVRLMGGGRGALMGQTRGTAQIQADRIEQDVLLVEMQVVARVQN